MRHIVYGIPNCGTVKRARAWLDAQKIPHSFVDFRAQPVGQARVDAWVEALGSKALRNTSGRSYRALPANKAEWAEAQWKAAFGKDPMLIKRPVIEVDGQAVMAGFKGDDHPQMR